MSAETEKPRPRWLAVKTDEATLKVIDALAASEARSRSNWIALQIRKAVAAQQQGSAA